MPTIELDADIVGSGAYARVHRGVWAGLEVAVKVMKCNEENKEVFERESRMLTRCRHKGVVALHFALQQHERLYLVLDFYATSLRPESLPREERQMRARELLEAIAAIHERGVLHLDLKPSNLLLGPKRRLVIADFGLAHEETEARTATRELVSVGYRAPEVILRGNKAVSRATDMWSVGCILAEIELGKDGLFQWKSQRDSLRSMLAYLPAPDPGLLRSLVDRSGLESYVPPAEPFGSLGGPARDLVSRLLHWDPAQRPSAREALGHAYFAL